MDSVVQRTKKLPGFLIFSEIRIFEFCNFKNVPLIQKWITRSKSACNKSCSPNQNLSMVEILF